MTEYHERVIKLTLAISFLVLMTMIMFDLPVFLFPIEYTLRSLVIGFAIFCVIAAMRIRMPFYLVIAVIVILVGFTLIDILSPFF